MIKRWTVSLPDQDGYNIKPFDVIFNTQQEIVLAADHDAEIERLQKERDEARGIATRSTLRSEKLRVIARQLYREIEGDDQHFDVWVANKLREAHGNEWHR